MATSYSNGLSDLFDLQRKAYHWDAGPIHVTVDTVVTSVTNNKPKVINLTLIFGHPKHRPRKGKQDDTNCYWLPSDLNQNYEVFRQKNI